MASASMTRRLPVINGYVSVPDGQTMYPTTLTPTEVLNLISGSTLVEMTGPASKSKQQFVELPSFDYAAPEDYYAIIKAAAGL